MGQPESDSKGNFSGDGSQPHTQYGPVPLGRRPRIPWRTLPYFSHSVSSLFTLVLLLGGFISWSVTPKAPPPNPIALIGFLAGSLVMSCLVYAEKETLPSEPGIQHRLTRRSKLLILGYYVCAYGVLLPALVHILVSSVTILSAGVTWGSVFLLTTVSLIKYNSVAVTRKERRDLLFSIVFQTIVLTIFGILLTYNIVRFL